MKGLKTLYYNGKIYYNVITLPKEYDKDKDLYVDCDCKFPNWKTVEKI